ncbi:MAG: AI-2E family transporter [Gemmatimonadetes bacterium]|nr:AI-2E family transporter [Gemmatimonadota bacterium]
MPPAGDLTQRKFHLLLLTWGLFLVLFLWSMSAVLGPFVLFLVLVYLLAPYYGTKMYGRLVTVLVALTALWMVWSAGFILTPFVLALVLAYILNPLVNRAQGNGLGRTAATAVVMVLVLGTLTLAAIVLGPLLAAQMATFGTKLPEFLEGALTWGQGMLERISHIPLPGVARMELGELLNIDTDQVGEFLGSRGEAIRGALLSGALGLGKGLGIVVTVISFLLITPILTFFLLRDFDRVLASTKRLIPPHRRPKAVAFFTEFDDLLARYLRSQVVVSLLVGIVIGVGFWIAGFPYALLLGVLAGVFNIIPYLGLILSLIPALLIALVSGNVGGDLLKILAVFGAEQTLENFFSARIVSSATGLHPVWVLLAIVLFSFFFGFIGLLIAVPAAVGLKLMLGNLMETYQNSTYYRQPEPVVDGGGVVPPAGGPVAGT